MLFLPPPFLLFCSCFLPQISTEIAGPVVRLVVERARKLCAQVCIGSCGIGTRMTCSDVNLHLVPAGLPSPKTDTVEK